MAPAGLGTDTDGSVRIPAALNGIAGLRPTVGRYSQMGVTPLSHTRDTVGPMARSVSDVVLLDQIITGDWSSADARAVRDIRLGMAREPFYANLDPEVARLAEDSLGKLRVAGFEIVEVDVPSLGEISVKISGVVTAYELNVDLAAYLRKYRTGLTVQDIIRKIASPDVKDSFEKFILGDQAPSEAAYRDAIEEHMPKLKEIYADAFAKYRIDALIFPTTPLPAQALGSLDRGDT
jgi:Asp-tRNA(Asn)/Glu-tRNA(Gln) amidotransferase A subunit family amidase